MTKSSWPDLESKIEKRIKYVMYAIVATFALLNFAGLLPHTSDTTEPDSTLVPYHGDQRPGPKLPPCGLTGSVSERIADCDETRVTQDGWTWRLVTRTNRGNEVWMEPVDSIVWGDAILTVEPAMKGRMTYTRSLTACSCDLDENGTLWTMTWVLPTSGDYERASGRGMREVLPNIADEFWTETSFYLPKRWSPWTWNSTPNRANVFSGRDGLIIRDNPERIHRVRCIGWR